MTLTTFGDVQALSSSVVLVLMVGVVLLLGVRTVRATLGANLSRLLTHVLDASIIVTFILYVTFVFLRFKFIG